MYAGKEPLSNTPSAAFNNLIDMKKNSHKCAKQSASHFVPVAAVN
jgi:hypothetical protein